MNTEKELETWWRMGGLNLPHKNACVEAFRLGRTHHAEAMSHGIEAMQMALVVLEDHDLAQKLRESIDRQKPINTEKELETWWQMGGLNLPHKNACVEAFHLDCMFLT